MCLEWIAAASRFGSAARKYRRAAHRGARALMLASVAVALVACGQLGGSVTDTQLAKIKATYDEMVIEREPLCIEVGPFPYRTGTRNGQCDRCQDLEQAGLLTRRIVDNESGGYVEYSLNREGEAIYRRKADPEYLDVVRARFARQRQPEREPDEKALERPRMCFGQTRFHSIADALSPFAFSGTTSISVKLVAEAKDTSGLLFDPRIAHLGLPIPTKPEPGKPALYPERVMTFEFFPMDGSVEISSLRYGAWVDEP